MNKSKVFKTAMAAAVASSAIVAVAPAQASSISFPDVPESNPFYKDIMTLVQLGAVQGYPGGEFKPTLDVRRDHIAKIVANLKGFDATKEVKNPGFKDVPTSHPQYKEIAFLAQEGFISGNGDGTYAPSRTLTRGEMAKILVKAFGLKAQADATTPFTDAKGSGFEQEIITLFDNEVTTGTTTTTYSPKANVTRQQLASFVVRAKNVFPENFAQVKAEIVPTILDKVGAVSVADKLEVSTSTEDAKIAIEVKDTELTKESLETVTDAIIDSLVGQGATTALKNIEINGVKYSSKSTVDAILSIVKNLGGALDIPAAQLAELDNAESNDQIFSLIAGGNFTGEIFLNFKDGERKALNLSLVVAQ